MAAFFPFRFGSVFSFGFDFNFGFCFCFFFGDSNFGGLCLWSFYLFFSSVLSFFLRLRRFCLFISVNIFFHCPFASCRFLYFLLPFLRNLQLILLYFFCSFWRFNSGNFLNAPLCVCRRKGEGAGFRSVLNLLDFNLCADCVKFCGTNFVSCVLLFFGHMFLVVALLLFTFWVN